MSREFPFGKGICYSGYRKGQSPRTQTYPTKEQIAEDLQILIDCGTEYIRMYDPNEHAQRVLATIRERKLPLKCMVGMDPVAEISNPNCAWDNRIRSEEELAANRARNDRELETLIALANEYEEEIIAVSIGNENQPGWGSDLVPIPRLVEQAKRLKAGVKQLVTYNEGAYEWLRLAELVEELDFISIHSYPVWNSISLDEAVKYNGEDYKKIAETYPGKQVIFTECGWPTECNDSMDRSQVDEECQRAYIERFMDWIEDERIMAFLFEAFDEPWKGGEASDEPEKHWGIFKEDRSPKLAAEAFRK